MEENKELLEETELEEIIIEDFTIETMEVRKNLRLRTFIVACVVMVFFIIRNFDPNIDFNNVNAPVFLFLSVAVLIICTFIYFYDKSVKPDEYTKEETYKRYKTLSEVMDVASVVPYLCLGLTLMNMFFVSLSPITGTSMEPNFSDDEAVIFSHLTSDYDRFDVIIMHQDSNTAPYLIKRVIGLPGETVRITDNVVYINDLELPQDFIDTNEIHTLCTNSNIGDFGVYEDMHNCTYEVPEGFYFVMGDNRDGSAGDTQGGFSIDSRYFGPVEIGEIYGKVVFTFKDYNLIK